MKLSILYGVFSGIFSYFLIKGLKQFYKQYIISIPKKSLFDLVGNTPIIYLKSLSKLTGCDIYAKLEYLNPGGSMKDRAAKQIILDAEMMGFLKYPGDTIYEGTSGSTGISLTLLANSRQYKTRLYLPNDLAEEKYQTLETLKAEIVKVPPVSIVDSEHICKLAEKESQKNGGFYANQFENLSNYKCHYNVTGPEIYKQMKGHLDIFVFSAGTGGTIAGVSNYLKEKNHNIKIVLADPPGSSLANKVNYGVLFTNEEKEGYRARHPFDTITEGTGLNRLTANFERSSIDIAYKIIDEESIMMANFLIENEGLFVGSTSAMNLVGCVKAARQFGPGKVILTCLGDSGMRYLSKFYNEKFLSKVDIKLAQAFKKSVKNIDFVLQLINLIENHDNINLEKTCLRMYRDYQIQFDLNFSNELFNINVLNVTNLLHFMDYQNTYYSYNKTDLNEQSMTQWQLMNSPEQQDSSATSQENPDLLLIVDHFDYIKKKRTAMYNELKLNELDIPDCKTPESSDKIISEKNDIKREINNEPSTSNTSTAGSYREKYKKSLTLYFPKSVHRLPTKSGYLKKKSPYMIQGWQDRYCEIKDKKFMYYQPTNTEKMMGCIDFDLISVKLEEIEETQFKILPYGSSKIFLFKTMDKIQRDEWVKIIREHITRSEGYSKIITVTSKLPEFWKVELELLAKKSKMTHSDFQKKVDTADILLFRSKNITAKLQRSLTGSDYDHVAFLLRYCDGEIVLLEATGNDGVGLCKWKTFMRNKWHHLYSRLVYRQLEIDRTEEMLSELEKFIQNVVGKKYKLSASKLLKTKDDIKKNEEDENTFFCSELVAACYKKLKLLSTDLPASSFWPGDFSTEKKLPLPTGVKLGPERLIDFNL